MNSRDNENSLMNKKVVLVSNTCWYLYNFRLPLLLLLREQGYIVELVAPYDKYLKNLESLGFKVNYWQLNRRSKNLILELKALIDLIIIYNRIRPDLVQHFTIKACLYGTIASKISNVKRVINSITGLGHIFIGNKLKHKLLRLFIKPIYKLVFNAKRSIVIFQNSSDLEKLVSLGITDDEKARLIRGSGVDISHFRSIGKQNDQFSTPPKILFPSRLIYEKGIRELLNACIELWSENFDFELLIAGEIDSGNCSAINSDDLAQIKKLRNINCLGHVNDMKRLYESVDIVVLPSWREGLSRSLIEAASMEKPIITTDVPGCRDVIDHGLSGILVPVRNTKSLVLAIKLLLTNPKLAFDFGKSARQKVINEFQLSIINDQTLSNYRDLLSRDFLV